MVRFFKNTFYFLFFLICIYVIGICLMGVISPKSLAYNLHYDEEGINGYLYTRIKEADTVKNVDLLVLGSSHAYRSFDPRIFKGKGIHIFNLGSSAQTFIQTKLLVDRYLERIDPKLVLIEVYPVLLDLDGVESSLDFIANSKIDFATVKMAKEVNHIKVYNTLIFGMFKQVFFNQKRSVYSYNANEDLYINGGYVQTFKKSESVQMQELPSRKFNVKLRQLKALKDVVNYIKAKEIPFMLVQTPILPRKFKSYGNVEQIDSIYSSLGPYINFNHILQLSDTMFYDDHHLNQHGVNYFNQKLLSKPYEDIFKSLLSNH